MKSFTERPASELPKESGNYFVELRSTGIFRHPFKATVFFSGKEWVTDPHLEVEKWLDESTPAPEITEDWIRERMNADKSATFNGEGGYTIFDAAKAIHSAIAEQMNNGWTDELVLKFAELYRWSSGRFSVKTFLQDKAWHNIEVKELSGKTIPDILKEKDDQLTAKEKEVERLKVIIENGWRYGFPYDDDMTFEEFKQQHNL